MTDIRRAALAAVLLAMPSIVAAQPVDVRTSPEPSLGDPMPDRVVTFANGVTALADVVFSTLPGFRPITLDLYRADARPGAKQPLVIYIHGGGWAAGHTRQSGAFSDFPAVLAELAQRGYAVASLEYRLSGEAPFPAAIQDVKAAIRFLRANADRYGIDVDRVAVWGGSAGGQLAALAAVSCGVAALDTARPAGSTESDCVQGGVSWYGVHDFSTMPRFRPDAPVAARAEIAYLDCAPAQCPPERVAMASPVTHVDSGDPPMLLVHGARDQVVPVGQSIEFDARLRKAGVPVELVVIEGADHSWIGADAAATRAASLKALDVTFAFFDRVLQVRR